MAKRHHSSARHDAEYSMRQSDGHYAGHEDRRRQEMEDGGMIREDHNAIANLPQMVMMKSYPKNGPAMPEDLDDTIRGVDYQIDVLDDGKRRSGMNPKKV